MLMNWAKLHWVCTESDRGETVSFCRQLLYCNSSSRVAALCRNGAWRFQWCWWVRDQQRITRPYSLDDIHPVSVSWVCWFEILPS